MTTITWNNDLKRGLGFQDDDHEQGEEALRETFHRHSEYRQLSLREDP